MANFQGYTFGQEFANSFANAYFKSKQLAQDQAQFDAKMAEERNQQSMLQAYRQQQNIRSPYESFSQAGYWDTSGDKPVFVPNTSLPATQGKDDYENFSEKGYWDKSGARPKWIANPDYKEPVKTDPSISPTSRAYLDMAMEDRETKKIEKIETLKEETGNILGLLQSAEGNKVDYKGNKIPVKMVNKIYKNKVEKLLNSAGLKQASSSLLLKAKKDNPTFDKLSKTEQRNKLKKYIEAYPNMDEQDAQVLYNFAETYRD